MERRRDGETERQRDRETERQRDRETERQRDREKRDRETERQILTVLSSVLAADSWNKLASVGLKIKL
jgi:hypothetical protein